MPCSAERTSGGSGPSRPLSYEATPAAVRRHASSTAVHTSSEATSDSFAVSSRAAQQRTTPTSASTHATSFVATNVTNVYARRRRSRVTGDWCCHRRRPKREARDFGPNNGAHGRAVDDVLDVLVVVLLPPVVVLILDDSTLSLLFGLLVVVRWRILFAIAFIVIVVVIILSLPLPSDCSVI